MVQVRAEVCRRCMQIDLYLSPGTELNSEQVRDLSTSPVLNQVKKEAETGLNSTIFSARDNNSIDSKTNS